MENQPLNPEITAIIDQYSDVPARSIILRVYENCLKEQKMKKNKVSLRYPEARVAYYVSAQNVHLPKGLKLSHYYFNVPLAVRKEIYRTILLSFTEGFFPTLGFMRKTNLDNAELKNVDVEMLLSWMGFELRHSGNDKKNILENPDVTYKRYSYLKSVLEFKDGRQVYYIEESQILLNSLDILIAKPWMAKKEFNTNALTYYHVLSQDGVKKSLIINSDEDKLSFRRWIIQTVLPILSPNSLVILDESSITLPVTLNITQYDAKSQIVEFLKDNNIPFDTTMHKTELWELAKRCFVPKRSELVEFILSQGHQVLIKPEVLYDLTPNTQIWNLMTNTLHPYQSLDKLKKDLIQIMNNIKGSFIDKAYQITQNDEQDLFNIEKRTELKLEEFTSASSAAAKS